MRERRDKRDKRTIHMSQTRKDRSQDAKERAL